MRYYEILESSNITDNEAFKRWFAGSRIVDASGRPRMMYHGTHSAFNEFRPLTHFGTAAAANERINSGWSNLGGDARVIPVYLRMANPIRITDNGLSDEIELLYQLHVQGGISDADFEKADAYAEENGIDDEFVVMITNGVGRQGYDGIVYKNIEEDRGQDSYIVLDPKQIRPAYTARITESLDSKPVEWEWTMRSSVEWSASFQIGPMIYEVSLFNEHTNDYSLSFSAHTGNNLYATHRVTGTGNASLVYATLGEIVRDVIRRKPNLEQIHLESDTTERNRFRVNLHLAKRIAEVLGFVVESDPEDGDIYIRKTPIAVDLPNLQTQPTALI